MKAYCTLTFRNQFDEAARYQAFQLILGDLRDMSDADLRSRQDDKGTMVIEVDNKSALQYLKDRHSKRFIFGPENF